MGGGTRNQIFISDLPFHVSASGILRSVPVSQIAKESKARKGGCLDVQWNKALEMSVLGTGVMVQW